VGDRVMQGPAFDAKAFRPPHPPDPGPLRTAIDPGPLAVYALRVLSTDIEARFAEPEIDPTAFQSEQNLSFISNVAREMFNQMRGGGINPVAFSTSCSSSCFGCTSCSSSGSGLVSDPDPVLTSILGGYVAVIPVEAQIVAQRLLEDPGALSQ